MRSPVIETFSQFFFHAVIIANIGPQIPRDKQRNSQRASAASRGWKQMSRAQLPGEAGEIFGFP